MRQSEIRPTGVERTFGEDELIVSKTDPKGIITYANDVFLRVSSYDESYVIGKPHNLIRHPDMPRSIFKLLWETIQSGEEIFAYVVNLAGDGSHYWVLAHVTPTIVNGQIVGYHSNRRTPDRRALDSSVRPLYDALLAAERKQSRPADAIAAGTALLNSTLASAGLSYDEWVWSLEQERELV